MHSPIEIADQTFIAAPPVRVREVISSLEWDKMWPGLDHTITEDRGLAGIRWKLITPIEGTMEFWLDPRLNGVMLHFFTHGMSKSAHKRASRVLDPWDESEVKNTRFFWRQKLFHFTWDQHGVRRNARNIAHLIKTKAEQQ